MKAGQTATLDDASRDRLAEYADVLISGGAGMPCASEANVHGEGIDRALAARPDLVETVHVVLMRTGAPGPELERLRREDRAVFDRFAYVIAGAYLMNPCVRKLLGLSGSTPERKPADPDEADHYLSDGILDPVIERGPIYRPTPGLTT